MIVGFQVVLIGLVADVISGTRKLLEDLLYRVRSMELAQRANDSRGRRARALTRGRSPPRSPSSFRRATKPARSATSSRELAQRRRWREILVVDDGSTDETAARAEAAGARVIRHPYNKGNGAAVKTGIRAATGEYILIIDGDGQHKPEDARRLVEPARRVRSRRRRALQRRRRRAARGESATPRLNRLASFLTEREIPDLTSGFRAARRARPASSSCSCCRTASRRRPRRRWRSSRPATTSRSSPSRRASARRHVEDPALARRPEVPADRAARDHDLQPVARLPAGGRGCRSSSAPPTPSGRSSRSSTSPTRRCC